MNIQIKLSETIINKLDAETVFILEHIGIPNEITPIGGVDFKILLNPYINNDCLILGEVKGTNVTHYLTMNMANKYIFIEWGYDMTAPQVFINSDIKSMLLCEFSYNFFIRRLIKSKALGAYYDNSSIGGNFEKYACLLEDILKDIDERATKEGVWHSLIEEMKLGVI
jgi:hypothetical protein